MSTRIPFLVILAIANMAFASGEVSIPKDVERFIKKREGCDHFRGEVADTNDKKRQKDIQSNIKKLCAGTDRQLNTLLKKYKGKAFIIERLSEFEPDIEAP
ncbi:hypothetical protein [Chitinimonas sp. BJB300]|uniref:hypothetical protein n=1 Tax=Chitinimonas sp. BJB300 TaxID=1559339 RepID=UPI000C1025CB|nr:hypothetical protein [Chitinimonas sp. BJB300]PHV11330.1 hypothetical protein CSQ89_11550 [Chitinimonas sp. BJB300]TSJ88225.1 hypothetical protein FG002_012010 [Chitinimonas sp. BJB300]